MTPRALAPLAAAALFCWTVAVDQVLRVVDGDTVEIRARVWFGLTATETVRLLGVDTPERHGATRAAGDEARTFTQEWLTTREGKLGLTACRRDSFGRPLGMIDAPDGSLAAALLAAGHGVVYERK